MAGYTRQSTASIINGENITAPPLNAEFNELADAFNGSTGHAHDGSTGNGPKIDLTTSVSGYLPAVHGGLGGKNNYSATTNPGVGDDTNDGYAVGSVWYNVPDDRYWVCVYNAAGAAVWLENRFIDTNNDFAPYANNTVDLGTSLKRFRDLWLSRNIDVDGAANIASTLYVGGAASFAGNVATNSLDVSTNADITGNLEVTGSSTLQTVDINGGYIDGTDIGTNNRGSGKFTTVNANAGITGDLTGNVTGNVTGNITSTGTSTFSAIDVNGGAIDGTPIGAADPESIVGTTITANTRFAGALRGSIQNSDGTVVLDNAGGGVSASFTGNVTGNLTGNVTSNSGNTTLNNLTVNGTADFTNTQLVNVQDPTSAQHGATKAYVDAQISNLVDSAPGALNTLNELAAAIGDDANFSTTITNSIATKLPLAGGTMTGPIAMGNQKITGLASPSTGTDAVNLSYVVSLYGSTSSAATSATNAATSASNAATSATQAAASFDTFDDRYLGAKATEPTVDNDGDALVTGAMFFDSTNNVTKIYNGSDWQAASSSIEGIKENFYYTATAGQTVFGGADDNSRTLVIDKAELVSVYMNGVRLNQENGDYTVSTGNDEITLQTGAAAGDIFEIEVFGNFAGQAASDVNIGGGVISGLSSLGVVGEIQLDGSNNASDVDNVLRFKDTDTAVVADQKIGRIEFETSDTSNPGVNLQIDGIYGGSGAGSELVIRTGVAGSLENRMFIQDVETVFNEDGGDNDFRIESDSSTHGFFLRGSDGNIGISTNSPSSKLHVNGTAKFDDYIHFGGIISTPQTAAAIYRPADNQLAFSTANDEAMRIDISQNILVGKTSTAINDLGIELRNNGLLAATRAGNPAGYFTRTTDDGDIIQLRKDTATIGSFGCNSSSGQPLLDINAKATESSQMRFTTSGSEAMRIASDGVVLIGTPNHNNANNKLYIKRSAVAQGGVESNYWQSGTALTLAGDSGVANAAVGINFLAYNNTGANNAYIEAIGKSSSGGPAALAFGRRTGTSTYEENARITENGHLLVGKTNDADSGAGVRVRGDGLIQATRANADPLSINRTGSDGNIAIFRKDGAAVGQISTFSDGVVFGNSFSSAYANLRYTNDQVYPCTTTGGTNNNAIDLGKSNSRFNNLWLSGGVYLGGTAAANKLDDYEEGTFNPFAGRGSAFTGEQYSARYTKIGRIVHIDLRVWWTATDGSGNILELSLPFSTPNVTAQANTGAVFYSGSQLENGAAIVTHIGPNSNDLKFYRGNGGGFHTINRSDVNGSYDILCSVTYETT